MYDQLYFLWQPKGGRPTITRSQTDGRRQREVQDQLIGKIGKLDRDVFEYELQINFIGKAIKKTRQERRLTQEQLGKLIGVQKA